MFDNATIAIVACIVITIDAIVVVAFLLYHLRAAIKSTRFF